MKIGRVIITVVVCAFLFVLLRITWNAWEFTQPPAACQVYGGNWSFLDGWSCL